MIIGVTGPLGAGKDTAADYIASKIGGLHVSGGDVLRDLLRDMGLEPKKSALGDFGTFLRTHFGANIITDMVEKRGEGYDHLVVSGFRSPVEAAERKRRGGIIVYIEAPDHIRHARIKSRQRAHDDIAKHRLASLDKQEHSSTSALAENLNEVRAMSDVIIVNAGSIEELQKKLDAFIEQFVV